MDRSLLINPAHILVGRSEVATEKVSHFLQTILCPDTGCTQCMICKNIRNHQHHAITWVSPTKWYTNEELEPIFDRIVFCLEPSAYHFFVLLHAERLLPAAANMLLKSIEEPPAGYIFFLLTHQPALLLPTVRSRCIVTHIDQPVPIATQTHQLLTIFNAPTLGNPHTFLTILDKTNPSEQETTVLLELILHHWQMRRHDNPSYQRIVQKIHTIISQPIPSGSGKLVWKNLYLFMSNFV